MQHLAIDDLGVDRAQPPGDAGEEARDGEGHEAHPVGVVADELDAFGVVAHRIEHAAQRRARQREHRGGADEAVDRDQVVDLDLRAETDAPHRRADHAVAGDAALAARELRQHQRQREHQLADAEGDHREGRARLLGGHIAEQRRTAQAGQSAHQRHQADRKAQRAGPGPVQRMDGQEGADAAVDRMPEAEHAALTEQDVVGQAGNDADAHLREHGLGQAAGPDARRDEQQQREQAPEEPAPDIQRLEMEFPGLAHQSSRVPSRPLGRKIRISTISR
mmetsp:Transcript_6613/g.27467  ORF Transcript_6613/g.27467 Transcript_6613/m.27467 type:complete len:277 (+) Transcript_6613:1178-2008(+)